MVQQRNLAVCVILSLVTFGIYGIYWFVCIHNDTKTVAGDTTDVSAGVAFLLTLVTCGIYGIYWMYKRGKFIEQAYKNRGLQSSDNSVIYLILAIVGLSIVAYILIQLELNKLAEMG